MPENGYHLFRPLVSVCIPTFNPVIPYFQELLASIEGQTWPSIEVVISDDCSEKFTEMLSALPPTKYERIISRADQRIGMAENWNRSAGMARGEYLLILGQDDLLARDGIERLVESASKNRGSLIFGGQGYIDDDGQPIKNPSLSLARNSLFTETDFFLPPHSVISLGLTFGNVLGDPCSTLIPKSVFRESGGFNQKYKHSADLEYWLRLASRGIAGVLLSSQVAFHRSHGSNATSSHVKSGIAQADRLKLHSDFGKNILDGSVWNRSVARLYMHATYDLVRYKVRPFKPYPQFRGSYPARMKALVLEVLEVLRLRKPNIHNIVQAEK